MVRSTPIYTYEENEVTYDSRRWGILLEKRRIAFQIMDTLGFQYNPIVHGSVARGDVNEGSDIDIFCPIHLPSYLVETKVEQAGYMIENCIRQIIQATPGSMIKAHLHFQNEITVTFPLSEAKGNILDFYRFGGLLSLEETTEKQKVPESTSDTGPLGENRIDKLSIHPLPGQINQTIRKPGVDKRLMLIEPTAFGHIETSILDREKEISSMLGISLSTIEERIRVLFRRDKVGRTGVFLKYTLSEEESFESALRRISDRDPAVRRKILRD